MRETYCYISSRMEKGKTYFKLGGEKRNWNDKMWAS